MTGTLIAATGVVLAAVAFALLFTMWVAAVAGVALFVVGVAVPEERLTHAKPAATPPRR